MVRSFFRLAIRDHFLGPLGCLLESFWGVFGLVLGHLGLSWARFGSSWARFGALRMACWGLIVVYSHQLIDLTVLGRSFFRLAVSVRFLITLRLLLGSSWVVLGSFFGHSEWHVGVLYSYVRINSSTYHPINLRPS